MNKKIKKILVCPQCGSSDLYYEAGLLTGYKYHCKRCNYIGPFVIEIDVELEQDKK
ncbi:MAG: TFIIB-type zinc ribbon-containing protein [Methanomassiliicoccales archaeon]|jgi:transposase-like protein|nr:TFIIB-type zinc ribbon-containing protein [Methanomassiliicoccales archaeon]